MPTNGTIGWLVLLVAFAACGGDGSSPAADEATGPADVPVASDSAGDPGAPDLGADVPGDVPAAQEVSSEVEEVAPDAVEVLSDPGVPPDAEDVAPDALPDAGPDALPDVAADGTGETLVPPDATDVAPDGSGDDEDVTTFPPDVPLEPKCTGTWAGQPWPAATDAAAFPRGPVVQSTLGTRATVTWRTGSATAGQGCVRLWPGTGQETLRCAAPDAQGNYAVALDGLPLARSVEYRVETGDAATPALALRPAPALDEPVRLMVFGDGHQKSLQLGQIAAAGLAAGVDAVIEVGDFVDRPELELFDAAFSALRPLIQRVALWPVIGNHEERAELWSQQFVVPTVEPPPIPKNLYYSARIGTVWIAVLENTEFMFGDGMPEVEWFKTQLFSEEARTARWRLVFIHEPPYVKGWGHCDVAYHGEWALKTFLVPLARDGNVNAIFSGHMHGYEHGRVQGVDLFVTGGGGGGLDIPCPVPDDFPAPWAEAYQHHWLQVDAGCDAMKVQAIGLDGAVLDTVEIQ